MKLNDLSIVIPTLNEEKYIGLLLDSLFKQSLKPKEIVIVDAFSEDQTITEIKKWQKKLPQLKYFQIPKSTIARQRNFGSRKVTSKHLLFLDADVILKDKNTLSNYITESKEKNFDIGAGVNLSLSDHWKDQVYFWLARTVMKGAKPIWPVAVGTNLYFKKKKFDQIKGFDELIRIGEDMEIVQRAVKNGLDFQFLKKTKVHNSVRRLKKEGRIRFSIKLVRLFIHVQTYGYRNNPIEYELGKH